MISENLLGHTRPSVGEWNEVVVAARVLVPLDESSFVHWFRVEGRKAVLVIVLDDGGGKARRDLADRRKRRINAAFVQVLLGHHLGQRLGIR